MDETKNSAALPETSERPIGEKTIIARSFNIEGELEAKEDALIRGRVKGNIAGEDHTVHIGKEAQVNGAIFAKKIVVEGKVEGQLRAKETVELRQTAEVKGTILAPKVAMEEGCQFNGKVKMNASALAAAATLAKRKGEPGPAQRG